MNKHITRGHLFFLLAALSIYLATYAFPTQAGWFDAKGRYYSDDGRIGPSKSVRIYQTIPGTHVESRVRPSYILHNGRLYHPIEGTNIPSLGRPVNKGR